MNKKIILLPLLTFALVACGGPTSESTSTPTPSTSDSASSDSSTSTGEESTSTGGDSTSIIGDTYTITYAAGENDPSDLSVVVSEGSKSNGTELTNGGSYEAAEGTQIAFYITSGTSITSVKFGDDELSDTGFGSYLATMPASDTALTITFYQEAATYALTWDDSLLPSGKTLYFYATADGSSIYTRPQLLELKAGDPVYIDFWCSGYVLSMIKYNGIDSTEVGDYFYFEMPASDVTLTFEFSNAPVHYSITMSDDFDYLTTYGFYSAYEGSGTPDHDNVIAVGRLNQISANTRIYIQALSDTREITGLYYNDTPCSVASANDGVYWFRMPAANVVISVAFADSPAAEPTVTYQANAEDPADLEVRAFNSFRDYEVNLATGESATFDNGETVYVEIYSATALPSFVVKANDVQIELSYATTYWFIMGTESVVITIEYAGSEDPTGSHSITHEVQGVTITSEEYYFMSVDDLSKVEAGLETTSATAGTTIYFVQAYLAEGYSITSVTMNGETLSVDASHAYPVYPFTMPSTNAQIIVTIA